MPRLSSNSPLFPLLDRTWPSKDGPEEIPEIVNPKHHAVKQRQSRYDDLIPRSLGGGLGSEELDVGSILYGPPIGGKFGDGHLLLIQADKVPGPEVAAARPSHRRWGRARSVSI